MRTCRLEDYSHLGRAGNTERVFIVSLVLRIDVIDLGVSVLTRRLLSIVFCEGNKGRETLGSDESGRVLR